MKKLLAFVFFIVTVPLFIFSACSKNIDFTDKISQIRCEIFYGKTEKLEITGYLEQHEFPLKCDGKVDALKNYLIFKINNNATLSGPVKAKIICGKEYELQFDFKPERDCFVSSTEISDLPTDEFSIIFTDGEKEQTSVKMTKVTPQNIITYNKALNFCQTYAKDILKQYKHDNLSYEVHIRLINQNNRYFWYVAFCDSTYTNAYLIDASDGKMLSQKTLKNN